MEENRIQLRDYVMPDFDSILEKTWSVGSGSIRQVLKCVSPTFDSYEERTDVINHMQRLLKTAVGVEVFPYGSVPLKTYLPEGDIDLTTISVPDKENTLANIIYQVLLSEEQNQYAEYEIHDLQFINAEVKIIKCIVGGIIMDVSFNQLGGLCSLCFLEEVDKYIRKDHIFKRSIILIKSWCYYESRIIGAHYGLFSTYALEILVLYIVLMYRESITNPLMVLYRFLEYYSKFDWDNFCMSINGPISVSSLLGIIVENPINRASTNAECLRKYINLYIVPLSECETNMQTFTKKYLNIIDPLKVNNNLGRSVNIGSSHRIRAAFNLGARTLGEIMQLPTEDVEDEIKKFFKCTLQRHQKEKFRLPALLTFEELITAPVTIDHYDDESETDMSNADYISRMDDVSIGQPSERNVPSIDEEDDRTVYPTGNLNVEQDGLVLDFGNQNENDVFDDDKLLELATLDGDYMGNIRNLVVSHCRHVFARPGPLLHKARKSSRGFGKNNVARYQTNEPYQQNSSWTQWSPNGVPMQPGPNIANHGVQQFVSPWEYSMRGRGSRRGRRRGPTASQRQPRRDFQEKDSPLGATHDVPDSLVQSPVTRRGFEGRDLTLGDNQEFPDLRIQSPVAHSSIKGKDLALGANLEVSDSRMQSPVTRRGFEGRDLTLGDSQEFLDLCIQSPVAHSGIKGKDPDLGANREVSDSHMQSPVTGRGFEGRDLALGTNHEVPDSRMQSPVIGKGFEGRDLALGANHEVLVGSNMQSTVSGKGFEGKDLDLGTNHKVLDSGMQSPMAPWGFKGTDPALGAKHEVPDSYVQSPIGHGHPGASSSQVNAKRKILFGSYATSQSSYYNAVVSGPTRVKDEALKLADEFEFPPL